MRVLLVFNPAAAHGRSAEQMAHAKQLLRQSGVEVELAKTFARGHATEIARDADFGNFDGIVAAGGDGTVFEVLNGCFGNSSGKRIPFGILPVGTGNAFSRDLGLETGEVEKAVAMIAGGNTRRVDVGHCTMAERSYYYLNILGLGFVSDVTVKAHRMKMVGNLSYTVGVLLQLIGLRSLALEMVIDGQSIEREAIFLEISNSRYTSNFLMAPRAEIDDGKLDVVVLGKAGRMRLLRCLPTVFKGTHVDLPEVEYFQASHIEVKTRDAEILSPDGEVNGHSPMSVRCLKQALEVFVNSD